MSNNTFGNRLKKLREEFNITQTELAKKFNISPPSISQYEKDVRSPDFNLLVKMADFFGVSTDYLLGRTDIREVNKGTEPTQDKQKKSTVTTMAAHALEGGVKNIDELEDLVNSLIDKKLGK